jgi:hypothetical protein
LDSLNKASGGKAEPLWQDNWDDDDVEDDFTKQLRYVPSLLLPFGCQSRLPPYFMEWL